MSRKSEFKISLMISIAFHLVCLFGITVVILPKSLPVAKTSTIAFLGPLFEKTAFDLMVEQANSLLETDYTTPPLEGGFSGIAEEVILDKMEYTSFDIIKKVGVNRSRIRNVLLGHKMIPEYGFADEGELWQSDEKEDFFISGPAGNLEIISKPDCPQIQISDTEVEYGPYLVELDFVVNSMGGVSEIVPRISSGYPEIDIIAIRYLKKFQFAIPDTKKKSFRGNIRIYLVKDAKSRPINGQ